MKDVKTALVAALKCSNANASEINNAIIALDIKSPIAKLRSVRALSNAMSNDGMSSLSADEKKLILNVISKLQKQMKL